MTMPLSPDPGAPPTRDEDQIVIECDLPHPPAKVWRALTVPELLAAWLPADPGKPADSKASSPEPLDLDLLSAVPHQSLRYRWRTHEDSDEEGRTLESVVSFELTPGTRGGTHLRIVHDGFRMIHPQRTMACSTPGTREDRTVVFLPVRQPITSHLIPYIGSLRRAA